MQDINQKPEVSIVIPIFNEEENIKEFYFSLIQALVNLDKNYEIVFIDDGSKDRSFKILKELHQKDNNIKIIKLTKNFGQSIAVLAGLKYAQGSTIICLDADLQYNPKDILRLIEKINEGYDVILGYRRHRYDSLFARKIPSFFMNKIISLKTGVKAKDWGCCFGAAKKEVINQIISYGKNARFIKPLLVKFAENPIEIEIEHYKRKKGRSKYNFFRLINSAFDFLINYSSKPSKNKGTIFTVEEIIN